MPFNWNRRHERNPRAGSDILGGVAVVLMVLSLLCILYVLARLSVF